MEAVSALNADGSSNTKKIPEKEKETTSKTKSVTTEVVKDIKKINQQSNTAENKEYQTRYVGDEINLSTTKEEIREITQDMLNNRSNMTLTRYSYEVGDQVDFNDALLLNRVNINIAPLPDNVTQINKVDEEYISESGNWKLRVKGKQSGNNAAAYFDFYFTRLKISSLEKEVFDINTIWFGQTNIGKPDFSFGKYTVKFPTAEETIGKLVATRKPDDFSLNQGGSVPKPSTYIDSVKNSRGNITYSWKKAPNVEKPGNQQVVVNVSDESGRSLDVTIPITIIPLPLEMSTKPGEYQLIQYEKVPKAGDYFDVVNHYEGTTYQVEWVNAPDMYQVGEQICKARATSSDGRTVEGTVKITILENTGLQVKLKPIEDRVLASTYPSLSNNFKDYIEEVTMLGKPVDINQLQLVVSESTEAVFSSVGQHEVLITVQMRHPDSDVMIKGAATTTVNYKWGNTILMRSVLSIRQGLASPLDEWVGDSTNPFELYYNFEVLRDGRSVYNQDVTNRATLQEVMNAFGDTDNNLTVQMNDIIQITHPSKTPNASVVMIKEKENDFTYGTEIARYRVTPYGFDPAPVMTAESAEKAFVLGEDVKQTNLNELVKNVRINGGVADNEFYTVEPLDEFDTSTIGKRNMRVKVTTKDKLASEIIEISYQVKWGDTFVIKGLKEATVGVFSLLKNQNQWQIQASQGVDGTNLNDPVDNYFGRDTYYSIEVLQGATSKFRYEVAGNQSIRESTQGFNNGQPLTVSNGDVIKVYHVDPVGKNLLMKDELVKDYTIGSNYAYYEVTDHGLEPILAVVADSMPQVFILGEDSSNVDGSKLINSITVNGTIVASNLYTVKQMSDFDTSVAGSQTIKVRIDTKDGLVSKEIDVPYEVKWGKTILIKAQNGQSAGAFSLYAGTSSTNRVLVFNQGLKTDLNAPISTDSSLYYSIEIVREGRSVYSQEIPGYATLEEVMANFGSKQKLNVQAGDIIKLYHPQRSDGSSVLLVNETEKDYTYGSPYANYRITSYGFEPMPVIETVGPNKVFSLMENTQNIDLSQLLANITINGERVESKNYKITQLSKMDTSTVGKREVKLNLKPEDGSADIELDVPYEVAWGSTFLLKGLDDQNVGAYSIVEQGGEWTIQAGKGDDSTVLSDHVNSAFGRDTYYRIEIVGNPENQSEENTGVTVENIMGLDPTTRLSEQIKYQYDVTGNMTVWQAINGFNNGQPLPIEEGDIVKVYHAEAKNNLLMRDDLTKNYTAGSNYAYYQVASQEFVPITEMGAETVSYEFTLGEDTSDIDGMDLIKNVTFNGEKLETTLYDVEQVSDFDTNTAGQKMLKVKLSTADEVTSTEVEVPYEVKWGSTIQLKNQDGDTVGAYSLIKENKQIKLQSLQGEDGSDLSNRITEYDDMEIYYGIEVFTNNSSKYKYEVRGTQTIEQSINRFNSGEPLKVSVGDQIKVYHADPSGNVLMAEEKERNYTYGSNYAYYNVTEYGFEPTGDFTVTPAEAKIVIDTKRVDLKNLLKEVKVNGKELPKTAYTVALDPETEIDTSSLGYRVAKLVVKADRSYGGFSTETEAAYEVVEKGTDGALEDGTEDSMTEDKEITGTDSEKKNSDGDNTSGAKNGNLPKTNETKNTVFTVSGVLIVSLAGIILFWRKRKANKNSKK
ncbi:LPXTG cell wall anchor domain-containing protein [Enterococcus hirae]|uniref:LPXTG cell wall anchor domain-containing protein n=1 Tax=Enterococcus hirae TaxID=1354 RepID=UPI002892CDEC|nr:LPXTG cell wall anchor domain-containing protein [Enterococcus hirae]